MPDPDPNKPDPNEPDPNEPDPNKPDPNKLGEAGEKALREERTARRAAERQAREAQAKLDELTAASQSEQEKAVAKAVADGKAEVLGTANARLVQAEVKAAAGGKLADPADAVRLIDVTQFTVADDGTVDTKPIAEAIDALVKDKPYLAAKPTGAPRGDGGGGPRGDGGGEGSRMDDWLRGKAGRH